MLEVASVDILLSTLFFMRLQNSEADNVVVVDIVFVDSSLNVVLDIDCVGVVVAALVVVVPVVLEEDTVVMVVDVSLVVMVVGKTVVVDVVSALVVEAVVI